MKFMSSFLSAMILFISAPLTLAQSDISDTIVEVSLPAQLLIGEEASVTIDVIKGDGLPWDGELPTATFVPATGVEEDLVFDCSNVDESDSCQANNRGVAGVYESIFTLRNSPVTMSVSIDGVERQVQLMATNAEQPVTESVPETVPSEPLVVSAPATAESLQVGPFPSVWILLIPLALMGMVVTRFVVRDAE